jgi:hypothetical protein
MELSKPTSTHRFNSLDNLRSFLTALVVVHHTAGAYGGTPPQSACFDKPSPSLLPVLAINQAFGLGSFFWISGRMSAQTLTKSSDWEFVKSKLWRLGIPTLLYSGFLDPLRTVLLYPRKDFQSNIKAYLKEALDFKGAPGSVWYTATLLIFDLLAVVLHRCRRLTRNGQLRPLDLSWLSRCYKLLSRWGWIAIACGSFLIGTKYPPGKRLSGIHVQPFYLLNYIFAYTLGHMAFHLGKTRMTGLFDQGPLSRLSISKALALSLVTIPIVLLPGLMRQKKQASKKEKEVTESDETDLGLGGWNMTAALYATWNEFTFNILTPAVMSEFEVNYNQAPKWKIWSGRYSYAAYLLHAPISWASGHAVDRFLCPQGQRPVWMTSKAWEDLGPVAITGVVSMVDIVASFGMGLALVDYVPGADSLF